MTPMVGDTFIGVNKKYHVYKKYDDMYFIVACAAYNHGQPARAERVR
jgi:hypothetical protein